MYTATRGSEAIQPLRPQRKYPTKKEREREHARILRQRKLAEEKRKRQIEMARRRAKQRQRAAMLQKAKVVGFVCAVFAIISLVVARYAVISSIALNNNSLKSQVETQQAELDELQLQTSMASDLQRIKKEATERLGMGFPKEYQVVNVQIDDKSSATASTAGSDFNASDLLHKVAD